MERKDGKGQLIRVSENKRREGSVKNRKGREDRKSRNKTARAE
ncbi:hypothetical protein [Methanosarcina horonobensis]|nr:hypothetical protein [Methanosarcina horonobensis]